jgi:hypothetical protein
MILTGLGATLGARTIAAGAARALLTVDRRADFDAALEDPRALLPAFLTAFSVGRPAVLADRPALFAECLLMDMNIAAYLLRGRSFLRKSLRKINGLPLRY